MKKIIILILSIFILKGFTTFAAENQKEGTVFAAASVREVLSDAAKEFEKKNPGRVNFNFAGSNVLAQQIMAKAPADLFVSANKEWVEAVEKSGRADLSSRRILFTNSLAIVANKSSTWKIQKPEDLAKISFRYLSIGNPEAVPAGKYAKAFLERINLTQGTLWDKCKDKIAPAADVRAALNVVESDPSILGIVYRTDAKASNKVKILYEIPENQAQPIEYYITQVKETPSNEYAQEFLKFLKTEKAHKIFEDHGFKTAKNEPRKR